MPRVSVIIPSYNHAAFIAEAVNSVLSQSEADLELIVVDDGSTDESLDVLAGFSDPRLRVFSQSNQGAHAAINRGLREARSKYLAILNSDDAYHPARLEKALRVLEAQPQIGLLGTYIEIVDAEGKSLGIKHGYKDCHPWPLEQPERSFRATENLQAALLTENYWATTSNFVFSRLWFERVGEFRPLRYAHDWDFALRMAQVAQLELLAEPLVRYRVHPRNTIRENIAAMIFEICWCLAVHLPRNVTDRQLFGDQPIEQQIDQLLHSIYTFGCDRVLAVMMLQLWAHPERAERLLDPQDPLRARYLEFILQRLAAEGATERSESMNKTTQEVFPLEWIKSILRKARTKIRKASTPEGRRES